MKTVIFESHLQFLKRENKELNGVSKEFAELHPDYEKQNETNDGCWNCSGCSGCSGCYRCSGCSDCSDLENNKPQSFKMPEVPVIENIHQKVLEAVNNGNLKMDSWHADEAKNETGEYCGTTHCRAGWVVALAGKTGVELGSIFGTENTAMQIYYKSSPEIRVSPTRFYESNEVALEDIERCAKEEIEMNANK